MATTSLIPKVNVKALRFDQDKWEKTKDADGIWTWTLKPNETDVVTVDIKNSSDDEVIECGPGSTIKSLPHDYEIVKRP